MPDQGRKGFLSFGCNYRTGKNRNLYCYCNFDYLKRLITSGCARFVPEREKGAFRGQNSGLTCYGRRGQISEAGRGRSSASEEQGRLPGGKLGEDRKPFHPRRACGRPQGERVEGNRGLLPFLQPS